MNENQRYAAVQRDIERLLNTAAMMDEPSIAVGFGSAILAAEIYERNERIHARHNLLATIERRIAEIGRVAP